MSLPAGCSQPIAHRLRAAEAGALMAFASMSCVQLALALSVPMFDQLGPLGVAALRLVWAGDLLLILVRPRPGDFTPQDLRACCTLGVVTAGLMLFFMIAIARIPLGTASAFEFLGPLFVSIYGPGSGGKRWPVMAAAGVVLLADGPSELGRVTWHVLLIMLALAALHPLLTFTLEYLSLRGLTAKAFGTLTSPEPAIALLAGLLVLGQIPDVASAIGVIFVIMAGIGAIRTGARAPAYSQGLGANREDGQD